MRSAWLRLLVFAVLVLNFVASRHGESLLVHAQVIGWYAIATVVALVLAWKRRGPAWSTAVFVVIDALLVVALFHDHLFAPGQTFDHSLTAPSLAIGFLLLTHAALRLRPGLVVLFSTVVLTGLAIAARHHAPCARSPASDGGQRMVRVRCRGRTRGGLRVRRLRLLPAYKGAQRDSCRGCRK